MFLGEHRHTIDSKGRLTIPAKFRPSLAGGVVVTRGLDGCLLAFPPTQWETLTQKINSLPLTQRDARDFSRLMYSAAAFCEPDGQGRILLPPALREYAALDNETIIVGTHTRFEIWNPQRWEEVKRKLDENPEAIAEHLSNLGLGI
ncbi:MAG: division/cell wall cluster transcriptional repressor MraZ [Chloroflexi bacterium]|nr:division/cell wall cluster transcriptional repressor MraZ [Chloroflexota bacterium]